MARRRRGRAVDGVLVLDKPQGLSSNHALQRAKRLFDAAKAGHTGSLDPLATGVLPLCFGEATKFSQYLLDADKGYRSTFLLGVGTDTADAEGEENARSSAAAITETALRKAMDTLTGEIDQVPPMYSALKRDGQPLYKLARQGIEVERKARRVCINRFDLLSFEPGEVAKVTVDILCTKGTYIRSLAEDLGAALSVPAHVSVLRRTQAGPFTLADAVTLDVLNDAAEKGDIISLDSHLCSIELVLSHLPRLVLGESAGYYLLQGQAVLVPNAPQNGMVRLANVEGQFLGVGEMMDDGRVAPRRIIAN
mgnify:FL=1